MDTEGYRKILAMAIEDEIAAHDFYKTVSEKTSNESLKQIFAELAEEEHKHKIFLEGYLTGKKPFHFAEVSDFKVTESIDKPRLSIDMKPADAIGLAMKAEEEAMQFYLKLSDASTEAEQKETFAGLANMEKAHKVRLEEIYTSIAYPEVW
jgi:rubrerythrin